MNQSGYLFLGLTAIVAALSAVLAYAVVKFVVAARDLTRRNRQDGGEAAFMTTAMEDAMRSLREQERAMKARAEASERLSGEIIASMTSGLLVVGHDAEVRTVNPAGRRLLNLPDAQWTGGFRELLAHAEPLADVIDESLAGGRAVF